MTDPIDLSLYPHGVRCACCSVLFEEGDQVIYREVGGQFVTPTCIACKDEPLSEDHPLLNHSPTFLADGKMAQNPLQNQ